MQKEREKQRDESSVCILWLNDSWKFLFIFQHHTKAFSMNSTNRTNEELSLQKHQDSIDVDADAAFAFELQVQEFAKTNNSSYRQIPQNSDALLAAYLQQEESRKAQQNQRLSHRTYQPNQSERQFTPRSVQFRSSNQHNDHANNDFSNVFRSLTSEFPNNSASNNSRDLANGFFDNTEDSNVDHHQDSYQSNLSIRSKALTNDQINLLPTERFRLTSNKSDEQNKCGVCWDQFQENETLRRLTCLHIYHKYCIDPWLQRKNQCPICREPPIK
ncbi:unnamed protein product [Adineta ricciae]|uniref:RING-type domain-containing protein n=1 Tax=Adineta ricciae TaxID=249248 RepID=A0A815RRD8_ADIRI|nr:unnamed protein product [Adineta ricciae]